MIDPGINDRRRGARGLRAFNQQMTAEERSQVEKEDIALREAEASAGLAGLMGAFLSDSDSDTEDDDYVMPPSQRSFPPAAHDHEAGGSGAAREDHLPIPTSEYSMTALMSMQQQMVEMQKQLIDMQKVQQKRNEEQDETLASLFRGQNMLLEQMREDRAQSAYQFGYLFQQTGILPPPPRLPTTHPLSVCPRPQLPKAYSSLVHQLEIQGSSRDGASRSDTHGDQSYHGCFGHP